MANQITVRRFIDCHRHLRDGELLSMLVKYLLPLLAASNVMPNIKPPVRMARDMVDYRARIVAAMRRAGASQQQIERFTFLMTIYLTPDTNPGQVRSAVDAGVSAFKAYPWGRTTNSEFGLREPDYQRLYPTFEAIQKYGKVLSLHGEHPGEEDERLREEKFLPILVMIANDFPDLKIVLEHVSTRAAVEWVQELPNVHATITAHHLWLTRDDVYGPPFNPHHKCMPIAKTERDRLAVVDAALSGNPKFMMGSDCAAHAVEAKEGKSPADAASGVFTAPVLGAFLVQFFHEHGGSDWVDKLQFFTSEAAAAFYGLPLPEDTVTFAPEDWTVPERYGQVVPFCAGETLHWQMHSAA